MYNDKRNALSICRSSQLDLSHHFVTAVLPWESNITAHTISPFLPSCFHYFFECCLQYQALQLKGSLSRAQTNTER